MALYHSAFIFFQSTFIQALIFYSECKQALIFYSSKHEDSVQFLVSKHASASTLISGCGAHNFLIML
jgi:hypothetical protein